MRYLPLALLAFVFSVSSFGSAISADMKADLKNGAKLYEKCIGCHKADATGKGLNNFDEQSTISAIKTIRDGDNPKLQKMRNIFVEYSEKDILDVSAYIQTIKK